MVSTDPQSSFDSDYYMEVNRARDAVFHQFLPSLVSQMPLRSAVDIGCGIGYYASYLLSLGLRVTGLDGRVENIAIARSRYPDASFIVANIEDKTVLGSTGRFDLVFCAGVLYHLENPFRAIRNLRAMCNSVCVIESRVHWSDSPVALLVRDGEGSSQALDHYAMVLSRRCMVNMLYASGFAHVYSVEYTSNHEELRSALLRKPRRDFFVASVESIHLTGLRSEPKSAREDMTSATPYHKSRRRFLKSVIESFRWLF